MAKISIKKSRGSIHNIEILANQRRIISRVKIAGLVAQLLSHATLGVGGAKPKSVLQHALLHHQTATG